MSSGTGDGAEEAAKDAGDLEAFFKTGETIERAVGVGLGSRARGPAAGGRGDIVRLRHSQ